MNVLSLSWLLRLGLMLAVLTACNLTTTDKLPTPIPTPDLPSVEILDPPNNVSVIEGTEFNIDIVARDSTRGVALIVMMIDGIEVNTAKPQDDAAVDVFRVTMNWRAGGIGIHVVEAVAYRESGIQSDVAVINVEVIERP